MKRLLVFLLLPIYVFSQDSLEWTPLDYTLASTMVIGQVLDFGLTNHALSNCGMHEANSIFGKNPSMIYIATVKTVITTTILVMVKYLAKSKSQRRWTLVAFNVITWVPVIMNINTLQKSGYTVSLRFSL